MTQRQRDVLVWQRQLLAGTGSARRYVCLITLLLLAFPLTVWAGMAPVGDPAPLLRVQDLEGRTLDLLEGAPPRALLVMFSSIGCVPCRESEPLLAAAGRSLASRLTVACVLLAEPERVRAMLAAQGAEPGLTFYADTAGPALFPAAGGYGVMGTPTTFLVGRDGRVLWRHVGALLPQHLREEIPLALGQDLGAGAVAANPLVPPTN